MAKTKATVYIITIVAIAFIAITALAVNTGCANGTIFKSDTNKEQSIQDEQSDNNSDALFIGCNGFF